MASRKTVRKKLAHSGAGVCVLMFFALLFSLAAAVGEIIIPLVYNQFYSTKMEHFLAKDVTDLLNVYHLPIIMAVYTLIVFIWSLSARRARKLGREYAFINVFLPIAICYPLAMDIIKRLANGEIGKAFESQYDSDKFKMGCELGVYGLPVLAGIFMMIAGFAVMSRVDKNYYEVELPCYRKSDKFDDPQSFSSRPLESDPVNNGQSDPNNAYAPQQYQNDYQANDFQQPDYQQNYQPDFQAGYQSQSDQGFAIDTSAPAEPQEFIPASEKKKPTVLLCPECGELVHSDEEFCSNCGRKM